MHFVFSCFQLIRTNADILEEWLQRNNKDSVNLTPDSIFVPADPLSKQALKEFSEDFAIEDMMEALDSTVQEDYSGNRILSPEMYLKQIRLLAKEQFFHRALIVKIRNAQNGRTRLDQGHYYNKR